MAFAFLMVFAVALMGAALGDVNDNDNQSIPQCDPSLPELTECSDVAVRTPSQHTTTRRSLASQLPSCTNAISSLTFTGAGASTGTIEVFTVPNSCTRLRVISKGARGGVSPSSRFSNGNGAILAGEFAVAPGTEISVLAGHTGVSPSNGGGGGSFVIARATNSLLVIAGGGGGSGDDGIDDPVGKHGQLGTSGASRVHSLGGTNGNGAACIGPCPRFTSGGGAGFLTNGHDPGFFLGGGGIAFVNGGQGASISNQGPGGFGGGGCGSNSNLGGGGGGFSGGGAGDNAEQGNIGVGGGGGSINNGYGRFARTGAIDGNSGPGEVTLCAFEACPSATHTCPPNTFAISADAPFGDFCIDIGVDAGASATEDTNLGPCVVKATGAMGGDISLAFGQCRVSTDAQGELLAFDLSQGPAGESLSFLQCGTIALDQSSGTRKRQLTTAAASSSGTLTASTTAGGDPHFKGLYGIEFDVFGTPSANYSLVSTPAFQVNMRVSEFGPELRYMTRMSVLYRGKSVEFGPMAVKIRKDELIKHFESLGAKITIDGWFLTVELCPQHTLVFKSMHAIDGTDINFLDLEVRVPGCHNSYGGLLGQTYQCKYATMQFDWSRDMEESFRVETLETPSGTYSPAAECANEDEYKGEPVRAETASDGGVVKLSR
jgi:hypothetical protein